MRCSVALCNSDNQSKMFDKQTMFFRFPKNPEKLKIWINACKRKDKFIPSNGRVCSKHFSEDDYVRDLRFELTGYSSKKQRILKEDAVPTLNLPFSKQPSDSKRQDRIEKREQKKVVSGFLTSASTSDCTKDDGQSSSKGDGRRSMECGTESIESNIFENVESSPQMKEVGTSTDYDDRDDTILQLKQEVENLRKENKGLHKLFSSNQIKKLKDPKKRVIWTTEDVARGIVIHSAGARAYRLLLKKGYPLPAVSTLRRWCSKIKLERGILRQVFTIVKKTEFTRLEKLCVLSFDEMKVRSVYMYDKANDETLNAYNYVQVAMLRGLFGNWKQPIFYDFDCQMKKETLFEIIEFAENAGFPVVAMVTDLGGGNRALHRDLNISTTNNWFTNPTSGKKIFVFADVPHLIKLMRNHFVDQGFIVNNKEIGKEIVEKVISLTSANELNIAHKISLESLNVSGAERQKVKFATKLFSHTISKAISRCGVLGKFDNEDWLECAEFFKIVNDWFDCCNARVPVEDSRDRKKAYGLSLDLQNQIIDKMSDTMSTLRVKGRKSLLPFQKGILMTNNSLKQLFAELKSSHKIDYILTYRLNQDVLENFFGVIRAKGGLYDHPTPLEFKYRLRSYILGRGEGTFSEATNAAEDDTPALHVEHVLSGQCFSGLADSITLDMTPDSLSDELDDLAYDGLENLAGFICHKLKNECEMPSSTADPSFTWVDHLSEGGLSKPTPQLMMQLEKLEEIFNSFNSNDSLKICKEYLAKLQGLSSHIELSTKIKSLFFRSRMYFRIRTLNKVLKDKTSSRKRKMAKTTS